MIEQTDGRGRWVYRLNPANPCEVQRKRNQPGARWEARPYRAYANEHDAKAALLRLGKIDVGA